MHDDRRNSRISDTRIFSPLLQRLSKHGALRGCGFCVGTQISDGLARQGQLVTGSEERSGKGSVSWFYDVQKKITIGVSMDKTLTGVDLQEDLAAPSMTPKAHSHTSETF